MHRTFPQFFTVGLLVLLLLASAFTPQPVAAATLLDATFNSGTDGFAYADDAFGTAQPAYASGTRTTSGGYGGSGGLQVSLGGVDANVISGMSGGWSITFSLAAAETGVKLSLRYKLDQTAHYEYDEYTRLLVKVDGVQYGRGAKSYVDHIGGDGSSSQGNSNSYLPTTGWQQHDIYLGDLAAGSHTLTLGGYGNKKDAADESSTVNLDDVSVTSGNPAPVTTDAETLVNRVDIGQFLAFNQGVAQFDDRCRGSGMGCASYDSSANPSPNSNYMKALAWVESQLQGMGYTTVRHIFSANTGGVNLYVTKLGSVTPTEMYMISGHLDGRGGGDAFNDDGSAVALLLEIARVLSAPDVTTDKSVRFIFWDKEEVGLYGSKSYASSDTASGGRRALQGTLDEPTWLGLITHDMILYDHGVNSVTTQQSPYADLDVEWRAGTTYATQSQALALQWAYANGDYAPDYPATAYNYSTNTDDTPFHPYVASISVRENRRSLTSGSNAEWINPFYHQTSDVQSSYMRDDDSDGKPDDIELGYNAVRTTLGLIAELAGAHVMVANQPPLANPQAVTTNEDAPVAITLTGSDADGNPLTFAVTSAPAHGTLSGAAPGLTYAPATDYNGADSFTFTVNDGLTTSAPATVDIAVTAVNDAPIANDQSVSTEQDAPLPVTLSAVDVDGDALSYTVTGGPANGALSGETPFLTYIPGPGYIGADSFTFEASDGQTTPAVATVSITVLPVNHPPVADSQAIVTNEDTAVAITLTGSDPDGDPLTFSVVTGPGRGSLSGVAPNLTYTPGPNLNGPDTLAFTVSDGKATSQQALVTIDVAPVNDAPIATGQSVSTPQDTAVAVTLAASDVDGDVLTYAVVSGPSHGTLTGAAPNLTYTPVAGYSGADSFTFTASDAALTSAPATISLTVIPSGPLFYLGSSTSGTAGGISFADEDILVKNQSTGVWALYFDGSDVGLANTDVDAFELRPDGSLLMSFDTAFTLSNFGSLDDSDILRFVPTSLGATTAGTWSMYFDGSDVGLSTSDEDVDAFTALPDGRLLISTLGSVSVSGASGADEDLLIFTATALGSTTSGTWAMYFDGSDVGLSSTSNEDINGVWRDDAGKLYLTTLGAFSVTGVSGDGSDVFVCTPSSLGSTTRCTYSMYWDGSANGFSGEVTDSLGIVQ